MANDQIFGVRKELLIVLVSVMVAVFALAMYFGTRSLEQYTTSRFQADEFILSWAKQYDNLLVDTSELISCACSHDKNDCREHRKRVDKSIKSSKRRMIETEVNAKMHFPRSDFVKTHKSFISEIQRVISEANANLESRESNALMCVTHEQTIETLTSEIGKFLTYFVNR